MTAGCPSGLPDAEGALIIGPDGTPGLSPLSHEGRTITTTLLNVAGVMERADEQVLPAVFKFVGSAYAATPSQLGGLTFMRAIVQALSSPFSGILGDFIDRRLIVGVGALWWGFFTILIAGNSSYATAMALWAANGLGLAAIIPSSQSLIADFYRASERGGAFGLLAMTGAVGALLAGLFATNVGGKVVAGVDGWRFAFLMVGVVSFTVGMLVLQFARDPRAADLMDARAVLRATSHAFHRARAAIRRRLRLRAPFMPFVLRHDMDPAAAAAAVHVNAPPAAEDAPPTPTLAAHTTTSLFASVSHTDVPGHTVGLGLGLGPHASPGVSHSHASPASPVTSFLSAQYESVPVPVHSGSNAESKRPGHAQPASARAVESIDILVIRKTRGAPSQLQGPAPKSSGSAAHQRVSWKDIRWLLTIPSFQIIIAQGVMGSTPWNAIVFFTLWLQLLGMSDFQASIIMSLFLLGCAVGNLLGGLLGDWMSRRWPNHGRIATAQMTVFLGIPFAYLFIAGLPKNNVDTGPVFSLYAVVALLFGSVASWAGTACNSPIFAEIVPARLRSSIYSYDRCFESALAACAAPIVGIIAEKVFGFKGDLSEASRTGPDVQRFRRLNAAALGQALLLCMEVPWAICLVFYTGLHWTYKKDRANMVRHEAEAASPRIQMSPYASPRPSRAPSLADLQLQHPEPSQGESEGCAYASRSAGPGGGDGPEGPEPLHIMPDSKSKFKPAMRAAPGPPSPNPSPTRLQLVLENGETIAVSEFLGMARAPGPYRDSMAAPPGH